MIKNNISAPIWYPGGKSRAVSLLLPVIPLDTKVVCSPFVGGGSLELACALRGQEIRAYDIFEPLVDFWQSIIKNSDELANRVQKYYPFKKQDIAELKEKYHKINNQKERAAVFYVLNKTSFAGKSFSKGTGTGFSKFNQDTIDKVRKFKIDNFKVEQADFTESIPLNKEAFLYLDPPYMVNPILYGIDGSTHKGFKHQKLKELLDSRDNWMLSYNDCDEIRELYHTYQILPVKWSYAMNKSKKSSEVIITSKDLEARAKQILSMDIAPLNLSYI